LTHVQANNLRKASGKPGFHAFGMSIFSLPPFYASIAASLTCAVPLINDSQSCPSPVALPPGPLTEREYAAHA
jgi:hypothetical protein